MKIGDLVKQTEASRTTSHPARYGVIVEYRDVGIFGWEWVVDTGGPGSGPDGTGSGFTAATEDLELINESR